MRGAPPHGITATMTVGSPFTDGLEILVIHGNAPAVLESVELVDAPGLTLDGFMVAGPDRPFSFDTLPGFPPRDPDGELDPASFVPGVGATLLPHEKFGYELLVGMTAEREGPLTRAGLRINYRVGDTHYSRYLPAQLNLCTDSSQEQDGRCPIPAETASSGG